jgi:hypothetical protein
MKLLVFVVAAQTFISIAIAAEECVEECVKAKYDIFGANDDACISFRKQLPRPMMGNSCYKGFWAAVEDFCKEDCDSSAHRMHAGQACRDFKTTLKSGCFHGYTAGSSFALAGHSLNKEDPSLDYGGLIEITESNNDSQKTQYEFEVEATIYDKSSDATVEDSNVLVNEIENTAHDYTKGAQGRDVQVSDLDVKGEDDDIIPHETAYGERLAEMSESYSENQKAQSHLESGAMTTEEGTDALFEDASISIDEMNDTALDNAPYYGEIALRHGKISDLNDEGEGGDIVPLATPYGRWV